MAELAVLGAAGGLGSACVRAALAAGHGARALLRTPRPGLFPAEARVVSCDARDAQSIVRAAEGCSALLCCVNAPLARWQTDMPQMLESALAACRTLGARLVFPGNVWSYGPGTPGVLVDESRPLSPSSNKGRVRARMQQQMADSGAAWVIARLPEFYGPNVANPLMGGPFRAALAGKPVTWLGGPLDVRVEYLYVQDGARAMLELALAEGVSGQCFHVPAGEPTTPRAFWTQVQELAGSRAGVRRLPQLALRAAALVNAPARELLDIQHLWTQPILLDGTRYRQRFGALPSTPFAEGIRQTLAWFREHPDAVNAN